MKQNFKNARLEFIEHFKYCPNFPNDIFFDQDEYAEELMKCIEDDFDYTIEKYGTRVPTGKRPKIIYD